MRVLRLLLSAATFTALFAAMVLAGAVFTAAIHKSLAPSAWVLMSSS
jgi:hypothetical protein